MAKREFKFSTQGIEPAELGAALTTAILVLEFEAETAAANHNSDWWSDMHAAMLTLRRLREQLQPGPVGFCIDPHSVIVIQ